MNTDPRRILLGAVVALLGIALGGVSWVYNEITPWGIFLSLLLVLLGIAYIWSDGTLSEELGV